MIKLSEDFDKYRQKIVSLWHECFGDDSEYINFFLDNCPDKQAALCFDGAELVSMLFLLEGYFCDEKCKYIYAACTARSHRKKGIMGSLIEFAKDKCRKADCKYIFLVPAEEELYAYYAKFGFEACFSKQKVKIKRPDSLAEKCIQTTEAYSEIKSELSDGIVGFRFSRSTIDYTVKEHLHNGGEIIAVNADGEKGIAFYNICTDGVYIKELLSNNGLNSTIIYELFRKYSAENIYIQCPIVYNNKDNASICTKCGMICALTENKIFDIKNDAYYAGMYLD